MDRVRCLTADGIEEFARYLKKLRVHGDLPPPRALLTDDACSVASTLGDVSVEPRNFASRRDFAEYIDNRFLEASVFVDADEPGMWEWLSLFYFDAVCPPNRHRVRKPGVEGRHLLRDPDARRRHRHLLRSPYLLFRQYDGGANGELNLLLGYALPVHGVAATHIGERHRLMASPGALVAASRLYFDQAAQQPRRGYSHNENGLRAYCRFINNLPESFDLSATSADTIIALLPHKFETWMANVVDEEAREARASLHKLRETIQSNPTVAQQLERFDDLLQNVLDRGTTQRQAMVRCDVFRTAVMGAYNSKCAISGLGLRHSAGKGSPRYEVEAAHIVPVARGGRDRIQNGLALNRTMHWAFDRGMLWVDQNLRVSATEEAEKDQRNRWLKQFDRRPINVPVDPRHRPSPEALRWHAANVAGLGFATA